jgi:hypothetical protein
MQDARYFRAQAELCLDIARQMSVGTLAVSLRDRAAQHFARAVDLESRTLTARRPPETSSPISHNGSTVMKRFYFPIDYDDVSYQDNKGELFLTLEEARAYAETVAMELGRNSHKSVMVFLLGADGRQLGCFPGGNNSNAR